MKTSKDHALKVLLFCAGLLLLFLLFRNKELYPSVFADEYIYSKFARLIPMSESSIPGYIYLKLYGTTSYCGSGFLGCAKAINAILFTASTPFIYAIGKDVASNRTAIVVAVLSVIGPINSYTAYFMPESFYFLSFWVFSWFFLKLDPDSNRRHWIAAGVIYGITTLIKPHSLFFMPAVLTYIAFIFGRRNFAFSRQLIIATAAFTLSTIFTKLFLGYLFAGREGVTIFGPLYSSIAASSSTNSDRYSFILGSAFEITGGHLLAICLIYGLPLAIALSTTATIVFSKMQSFHSIETKNIQFEKVAFLSLAVIANLVCITALFTASVAKPDTLETIYRLHMRYYNFALPLFYIVTAGALTMERGVLHKSLRYAVCASIAIFGIYALYSNLTPYTPSYVDSPEIRGLHTNITTFRVVGGLLILALIIWAFFERAGIKFYLYLALPMFALTSSYHITAEQNRRLIPDVYDKAGIFTKSFLSDEEMSKIVVIGSSQAPLYRTLFHLDNAKASFEVADVNAAYDLANLPQGKSWALIVGNHSLLGNVYSQLHMKGFVLVRISSPDEIDFKNATWPGVITKTAGLSPPESWGARSNSNVIDIEFSMPLPEEFDLHLAANSIGSNASKQIAIQAGTSMIKFELTSKQTNKTVRITNPGRASMIRFYIPSSASPNEQRIEEDKRNIDIGITSMKIVPTRDEHSIVQRSR